MANIYAQKIAEQQQKTTVSKKKRLIIIASAMAGLLALLILILALVPVRPYDRFSSDGLIAPKGVMVYKNGAESLETWDSEIHEELYDGFMSAFKKSSFSVLRGWLEGKFFTGLDIELKYEDEDAPSEDTLKNGINESSIKALPSQATETKPLVVFWYESPLSVTVGEKTISYNRLAFFVENAGNIITNVQVYFYNTNEWGREEIENWHTYEIYFMANMERLALYLGEKGIS